MYPDYNMYSQYYGLEEYNYRNTEVQDTSGEVITFNQAIGLIRKSVSNEKTDEMFYDILIKQATTEKEKNIIRTIRNDERKHNQILRRLYFEFTVQTLQLTGPTTETSETAYKENLEKALFDELDAVKKYRKILGVMPSGSCYILLMSIMTDELIHASKYNFLIHNAK